MDCLARDQMISKERVEAVLGRIRPMMQADGGDIELVDVQGNSAHVRLPACARDARART